MLTVPVIARALSFVFLIILLSSCDDVVDINTEGTDPVLVIDAWVNDKSQVQTIYLTFSQDYFDNKNSAPGVSGAKVVVTDNAGNSYQFIEQPGNTSGAYQWHPSADERLGVSGRIYTLTVEYDGEDYKSSCVMGRVPAVDSISFKLEEGNSFFDDEYRAEFWGTDLPGKGDTYWIKTYKNSVLMNKASEINIAYDAGRGVGNLFDGVTFISPIRMAITPNEVDENGDRVSPLKSGDSLYVEIHSLTAESYNYLNEVITQTNKSGGFSELFTSTPLANVSSNITNTNPEGSPVVGFFNVSAVAGKGRKFQ